MDQKVRKIFEFGFEHSTARAIFILSVIASALSVVYAEKYVTIAFFTLFYTFLAYRVTVLRRAEVWGDYLVKGNLGAALYFLTDWFLFVSWISGVLFFMTDSNLAFQQFKSYNSFLLLVTIIFLVIGFLAFVVWLGKAFFQKVRDKK